MLDGVKERVKGRKRLVEARREASSKEVVDQGRRTFMLRSLLTLTAASAAAVLGPIAVRSSDQESSQERPNPKKVTLKPRVKSKPDHTVESLQDFIEKFENKFLLFISDSIKKGGLPDDIVQKLQDIENAIQRNKNNPYKGNYLKHQEVAMANNGMLDEPLDTPYFDYDVITTEGPNEGIYASYMAEFRLVEFGPDFDLDCFFDMTVVAHEINHAIQDIKVRESVVKSDSKAQYANYFERYLVGQQGLATKINLDDEFESYSISLELINQRSGGLLKEAAKAGAFDNIQKNFHDYKNRNANYKNEEERRKFTEELVTYVFNKSTNPEACFKLFEESGANTDGKVFGFIYALELAAEYFKDPNRGREFLKKDYEEEGVPIYENAVGGPFRRLYVTKGQEIKF